MQKWFHITFSTYGTWLPGDERGFRAYKHKIHSSGDYRNRPPKGEHSGLYQHARSKMCGKPVTLTPRQRKVCGRAMVEKLNQSGCEIIVIAVGGQHVHIQLLMEDRNVKRTIGYAKQYASLQLHDQLPGKIWATSCRSDPVRSKQHQQRLFQYIERHRREGAYVWTYQDRNDETPDVHPT